MTRFALAVLAAAVLAASASPASATGDPEGLHCGYTSINDPTFEGETATVYGGPVVGTGTLTCTIQVDAYEHGTTDNDAAAVSATGTGVVVLPSQVVTYSAPGDSSVVLCTQFTPDGGATLYWDGLEWTTDASSPCEGGDPCACDPDPLEPVWEIVDPLICPVLAHVAGPLFADPDGPVHVAGDGDVHVLGSRVWDCPPYGA